MSHVSKKIICPWKVNPDYVFENGRLVTVSSILTSQDYFFLEFCFGEYCRKYTTIEMMLIWNQNHGDKLILNEMDCMEESFKKMKQFYKPKFKKTNWI